MRVKAFVIVDTNILVSGMLSNANAPNEILKLIDKKNLIPLFDNRILNEYYQVLNYDKFKEGRHLITNESLRNIMYVMVKNGIYVNDVDKIKDELYNIMPDKDDIHSLK